jgi:ATP-binding cassette subfamily B protein
MMEVAVRSGLLDFTRTLPLGLETVIVEQGANLSGGQKQKIALARALYRNSPILLLDEPTASLDASSESQIMQTIDWYKKKGNTVIIISHSDIALKICDNIVILKN